MSEISPTADDATVAAPHRWWTLATVALAQLMVVLDATVVNIALPSAQTDLGFSNADRQWVVTAYSLAFGSLLLLGGRVSDLIGRKRTFIIGLIGFAGASALGGAATSFGMLVGARALQGAFGALLAPTALAVLTTTFTIPKERARAFGVFGAIAGAGGAIGLLLGGLLTENFDWRWNLYINVIIAVVAVVGASFFVRKIVRVGMRPKLDVPGTLLVSAALFSLVYGFSNAETDSWSSPASWGFLTASRNSADRLRDLAAPGRASAPAAVDRARPQPRGRIQLGADRRRRDVRRVLFVTYYLQTALHYSPIQTGISFLPMIGMLVLFAQLSTNIFVPRFGPKIMVPIGMLIAATALAYLTHLDMNSTYAADILPPLMIMGAGMGTIMPASIQTATLGVERGFAGVASAMVNTSQQVGGSIGTALLNTIAASAATAYAAANLPNTAGVAADAAVHSYSVVYLCASGFFAFGAVLAALLFRRRNQGLSLASAAAPVATTVATTHEDAVEAEPAR